MHPHHVSFHIPGAGLFSELLSTEFAVSWIDVHLSNRAFWVTVGHFFVRPQVLARLENFIAEITSVFWVRRFLFCMLARLVIFQAVLCDEYFIADSARKVLLLSNIFFFEQVKFVSMNALLVPVKIFLQPEAIFAQLTEQMATFGSFHFFSFWLFFAFRVFSELVISCYLLRDKYFFSIWTFEILLHVACIFFEQMQFSGFCMNCFLVPVEVPWELEVLLTLCVIVVPNSTILFCSSKLNVYPVCKKEHYSQGRNTIIA